MKFDRIIEFVAGLFVAALLTCNSVAAQSPPDQAAAPKDCDAFFVAQLGGRSLSAEIVLSVHISKDGTLSNVSVLKSGGDSALDQDAISCAEASSRPQLSSGEPVEVDWQATIRSLGGHIHLSVPNFTACSSRIYPASAVRQNEQGWTRISFSIGDDGNPTAAKVIKSSGYGDLGYEPNKKLVG